MLGRHTNSCLLIWAKSNGLTSYITIAVLDGKRHTYHDDLESFPHVLM